jgi:hypothetical protein
MTENVLRSLKRTCSPSCTERKMGSGEWDRCTCGAVADNQKIDEALK